MKDSKYSARAPAAVALFVTFGDRQVTAAGISRTADSAVERSYGHVIARSFKIVLTVA